MSHDRKTRQVGTLGLALLLLFAGQACQKDSRGIPQSQSGSTRKTQIVLLGTGTPSPDPERSGPCTAIVVNGTPYLVDFGTGLVRRAAAARKKGVEGLDPINLKIGFVAHLHADHTLGFPMLFGKSNFFSCQTSDSRLSDCGGIWRLKRG